MKLKKRPAAARGRAELGWLHSQHTFSFGEYRDPAHMGFRKLRVINEDVVEPGQGFGTHGHENAEILSYVLEGRLEHKDSMGNGSIIETGCLQYMSAGSGVTHSEFNPSRDARVHLLQIWILPDASGGAPRYAEKRLPSETRASGLSLVFSGKPRDGAIEIRADADVYLGRLDAGHSLVHSTRPERGIWIQVVEGSLSVGDTPLAAGDGAAIEDASEIVLESEKGAGILLFDLR
jgi:redox-sensitive bicupin YhaK (pirin superfamily)